MKRHPIKRLGFFFTPGVEQKFVNWDYCVIRAYLPVNQPTEMISDQEMDDMCFLLIFIIPKFYIKRFLLIFQDPLARNIKML